MTGSSAKPARVAVVIPLYNKGPHIARALDSILAQSVQDFEIVVVDDASTDGGAAVVERHPDPRVRLVRRDRPGPGGHAARNAGIKATSAPLIAFLDADDAWEPEFLATILRLRAAHPEAGAYATAYRTLDEGGRSELKEYHGVPEAPWEGLVPDYFGTLIRTSVIWTSVVAIPRDVFAAVGIFPEGVPKGGDLEMWFRIAIRYPIAFSRYVGGTWFRDSVNRICETVQTPSDPVILHALRRALQDPATGPGLAAKLRALHDALIASFAKHILIEGRPAEARALLAASFGPAPVFLRALTFVPPRALAAAVGARRRLLGLKS